MRNLTVYITLASASLSAALPYSSNSTTTTTSPYYCVNKNSTITSKTTIANNYVTTTFGIYRTSSVSSPNATGLGACGPGIGSCASGQCCSGYGFCGYEFIYCGPNCMQSFGICGLNMSSPPADNNISTALTDYNISYAPISTSGVLDDFGTGAAEIVTTGAEETGTAGDVVFSYLPLTTAAQPASTTATSLPFEPSGIAEMGD